MRTGAARGHEGHFHEAGFYGSDAEFAALIVLFAEEGIAAGEPVVIGYDNPARAACCGRGSSLAPSRPIRRCGGKESSHVP
jgi:hypothetical protein